MVLSLPLRHKLKTSAYLEVTNMLHFLLLQEARRFHKNNVGGGYPSEKPADPPEQGVLLYSLGLGLPFPNLGTTFYYPLVL